MTVVTDLHITNPTDELMKLIDRQGVEATLWIGFLSVAQALDAACEAEEYDWVFYEDRIIFSWNGREWRESKPSFSGRGYRLDRNQDEAIQPGGHPYHKDDDTTVIVVCERSYGERPGENWDDHTINIYTK